MQARASQVQSTQPKSQSLTRSVPCRVTHHSIPAGWFSVWRRRGAPAGRGQHQTRQSHSDTMKYGVIVNGVLSPQGVAQFHFLQPNYLCVCVWSLDIFGYLYINVFCIFSFVINSFSSYLMCMLTLVGSCCITTTLEGILNNNELNNYIAIYRLSQCVTYK